ncbi:hypothetical protein AB1283_15105 [Bacillus sp. S13(2024)]|uniref:hypothetical protein n=1 Tax=unclassified Bacillus (in: firmicutes) TaxID=185979 RepID=UPI003D1E2F2D
MSKILPKSKDLVGFGTIISKNEEYPVILKRWFSDDNNSLAKLVNSDNYRGMIKKSNGTDYFIPTSDTAIYIEEHQNHMFFNVAFENQKDVFGFSGETDTKKAFLPFLAAFNKHKQIFLLLESPSHSILIKGITAGKSLIVDVGLEKTYTFDNRSDITIKRLDGTYVIKGK